jgi:hypothetical protein
MEDQLGTDLNPLFLGIIPTKFGSKWLNSFSKELKCEKANDMG